MKLKVVGWTNYDNKYDGLEEGEYRQEAKIAIVADIREHGYKFSGTDHQSMPYCAPVLSDGKIYRFNQRAWGHIMAEAHGFLGRGDYVNYAFDWDCSNDTGIRPTAERAFDPYLFTPEADLSEAFEIEVSKETFAAAERTHKITIDDLQELRFLGKGDTLKLRYGEKTVDCLVTGVVHDRDLTSKQRQEFEAARLGSNRRMRQAEEMYRSAKAIVHVYFEGAESD